MLKRGREEKEGEEEVVKVEGEQQEQQKLPRTCVFPEPSCRICKRPRLALSN